MVEIPSKQGVERSLLSWLDGVGWETHGLDGGRSAGVLDDAYDRDRVVHELAHLRESKHNDSFWSLVAEYDSDYEKHYRWLDEDSAVSLL